MAKHIYDLPNEILEFIFKLARGGDLDPDSDTFVEEWQDAQLDFDAVRSIRLTCRNFCGLASPLLLRRLDVSLTFKSLQHFKEVTESRAIASGIRAVCLNVDCYFESYTYPWAFAHLFTHTLFRQCINVHQLYVEYTQLLQDGHDRNLELEAWFESNGLPLAPPLTSKAIGSMDSRARSLFALGQSLLQHGPLHTAASSLEWRGMVEAIRTAHVAYQRRCQEQAAVLRNHHITVVLAQGIARSMPKVQRLLITDDQEYLGEQRHPWPAMLDDVPFLLERVILRPRRWDEWHPYGTGIAGPGNDLVDPFPSILLPSVPLALLGEGHSLSHLDIQLSTTGFTDMNMEHRHFVALTQVADALKTFRCILDIHNVPHIDFITFLKTLTAGKRLQSYHVASVRAPSTPTFTLQLADVLALLSSPDLTKVTVSSCALDVKQIRTALSGRKFQLQLLVLRHVAMESGTKEEAAAELMRVFANSDLVGREITSNGIVIAQRPKPVQSA